MVELSVQLASPPKNLISQDIQRVAILNRALKLNFTDSSNYLRNGKTFKKVIYDSIAADTAIKIAARAIFSSQRFDVTIPRQMNFFRNYTNDLLAPLDTSFINPICKNYDVDALLVLENFTETAEGEYRIPGGIDEGYLQVSYSSAWRFYDPSHPNQSKLFRLKDILSWRYHQYYAVRLPSDRLPTVKEALIEGGIASGETVAVQICPVWTDTERYFFKTRNKAIDKAIPLMKENKWTEAAEVWKKYSSEPDLSLRSRIEYNIALAEELNDNLNEALEWINKSLKTKYSEQADNYGNELRMRITKFMKIQKGYRNS
jgi:tetratricopeptide (TPR) repeat protein